MNIFDIFSLNKHGDYQEILFSSALSYLLNPKLEKQIGKEFLKHFLNSVGINVSGDQLENVSVKSERDLGEKLDEDIGRIDLFIETKSLLIGIEVKIWNKSANNTSKSGEEQLLRYARGLEAIAKHKKKGWLLLFIVPHLHAKVCAREYSKLVEQNPSHAKVLPLMELRGKAASRFKKLEGCLETELSTILSSFKGNSEITDSMTKTLINDLHNFLTEDVRKRLYKGNPDPQKFPSNADLQEECEEFFKLLKPFLSHSGKWANAQHTTIGIPHKLENPDVIWPYKALYRIRTTKKYYTTIDQKVDNYPKSRLELELWSDVYKECKDELDSWITQTKSVQKSQSSNHLYRGPKVDVEIVLIERVLDESEIENFEQILREGFMKLIGVTGEN